jgi:hypothetical protein
MSDFATKNLPPARDAIAPDGSSVRVLLGLSGGGMAHFELPPQQTSKAVVHRTVEEIWFFLSGRGEMWRSLGDRAEVVDVHAGVCIHDACRHALPVPFVLPRATCSDRRDHTALACRRRGDAGGRPVATLG